MDMDLTLINYRFLENARPPLLSDTIHTTTADIASHTATIRAGTDIATVAGIQIQSTNINIASRTARIKAALASKC